MARKNAESGWADDLISHGWIDSECELLRLCKVLVSNDIHHSSQMKHLSSLEQCTDLMSFTESSLMPLERIRLKASNMEKSKVEPVSRGVKRQLALGDVKVLEQVASDRHHARGGGPRATLRSLRLGQLDDAELAQWCEQARVDAILGSQRLSTSSLMSGIRCYISFASEPA